MELPKKVELTEVGPRDGFQNVKDFIETEHKIEIAKTLIDAGFKKIEITSFVNPKWIPQLVDANEVVAEIKKYSKEQKKDVELVGLAPNKKGFENAEKAGVDWVTYVCSVSEKHNMANVNRTVEESMNAFEEIMKNRNSNMKVRIGLATAFGCPFGEKIETSKIIRMAERALNLGTDTIMLADTVGLGDPALVDRVLSEFKKYIDMDKVTMHLHDTRGLSLANTYAAMLHGAASFESAAGGLGGCPFAPGAAGNVASEDIVNMMNAMGVETGIDMEKVLDAVSLIRKYVNAPVASHMAAVCKK